MAKKATRTRSTVAPTRRSSAPAPQPQQQQRPPFLKAGDVGRSTMLKFVPGSVRTFNGKFGHQLIVDVTMRGGSTYSWGIGTDKPNLRLLVEHLISNPGKPIEVTTQVGNTGRAYIAIPQEERPIDVEDDPDDDIPF